ncbi:uncharacterized protein LOC131651688 [Vicia villosa]|uniref:uncharacterized protein LOC131651688 n=1 Tax=Vicia villosa TaxID=3911 RepID=UPI00273ACBBC|nr:uncharacterized protein LOC131651688 [Vicia villosa]
MDEAPAGSSFAPRSRMSRASSSRGFSREEDEEEEVHEKVEVPEVHPEHDDDGQDDAPNALDNGYPGGPSDTSVLIYYHNHAARHIWDGETERTPIKSVNHSRKFFNLFKPQAQWFNDVVAGFGLGVTSYHDTHAPGCPPRSAHEELLENQRAEDDHATDLMSICQWI